MWYVFKITPSGTLTTLHSFDSTDGAFVSAALVYGTDGNLYGTTRQGGANDNADVCDENGFAGCGTLFKITPNGTLTTLYNFCSQNACTDGANPWAGLVQATNGNFYGTTHFGGANGDGTVFKITPSGTLTTLYNFCSHSGCTDGANPQAALIEATNGSLYGTAYNGGLTGYGTVFKMSLSGALTTLYYFCSQNACPDGAAPTGSLVQATDGNFYGTTAYGGGNGSYGTLFKITPNGELTTLYSFCLPIGCTDGEYPLEALVQDTNGSLYGTAYAGGTSSDGTVFSLSVGLGPFVKLLPDAGKVGAVVKILGTNLRGATSVTFNGTAATFTVQSATAIKTTVPSGATTGPVQVVTPSGTLTSNVNFQVLP